MLNLKNKKLLLLVTVAIFLVLGLSVASATNITKTDVNKVSKKISVSSSSNAVKDKSIDKKVVKNTTKESIKTATSKTKTKVTISNVKKQYEVKDQLQVKAKLTDENNNAIENQNLTLKFNKKSFNVKTDEKGCITEYLTISSVGKQDILLTFAGSNRYFSTQANKTFTSTKRTTYFVTDESNFKFHKNSNVSYKIYFELKDKDDEVRFSDNEVKISINDKIYDYNRDDSTSNVYLVYNKGNIDSLNNSKDKIILNDFNQISITYLGNKNYLPTNYSFNLTKGDKYHSSIEWFEGIPMDSKYNFTERIGSPIGISAYLRSDCKNHYDENEGVDENLLKIKINGKKYTGDSMNPSYMSTPGTYIVSAEYPGSSASYSSYLAHNLTIKIMDYPSRLVLKKVPQKNIINKKMTFYTTMNFNDGESINCGKIYFNINGKVFKRDIVDGVSSLDYTPKKAGKYNISLKIVGFNSKKIKTINTNQSFSVAKGILKRELKVNTYFYKNVTKTLNQRVNLVVWQFNPYNNMREMVSSLKMLKFNINGKKYSYKTLKSKFSFKEIDYLEANNSFKLKKEDLTGYESYYTLLIPTSKNGLNTVTISNTDKKYKFSSKKIKYSVNDLSKSLPFHIKLKSNISYVGKADPVIYTQTRIYAILLNKKNKILPIYGVYQNYNISKGCFVFKSGDYQDTDYWFCDNIYFSGKIKINIAHQNYTSKDIFYVHNNSEFTLKNKNIINKKTFKPNEFPNVLTLKIDYSDKDKGINVYLDNHKINLKKKYDFKLKTITISLDKNTLKKYLSNGRHILTIELYENYGDDIVDISGEWNQKNYYDIYIKK